MPLHAGLLLLCAVIGCAHSPRRTMSDLRSSVSQVLWPRTEAPEGPRPAEPSVVANAAIPTDAGDEASNGNSGSVSAAKNPGNGSAAPANPKVANESTKEPASGISVGQIETSAVQQDQGDEQDAALAGSNKDNIERLKAALNEDALRAKEPAPQAGGAHDVRVRVESLVDRAKRLFASGRLREARHTAQIAQDLGETARLDFPPDEERPVDLLHRIEDQIQEESNETLVGSAGETEKSVLPASSSEPAKYSGATDPANRARLRRDWAYGLNVFRRDRKVPANESAVVPPLGNPPATGWKPVVASVQPEPDVEPSRYRNAAVVQANRGFVRAVAPSAELEPSTGRTDIEPGIQESQFPATIADTDSEPESTVSSNLGPPETETETDPLPPATYRWVNDPANENRSTASIEELAPPEFDDVPPIVHFHDVAKHRTVEPVAANDDRGESTAPWAGLVVGICFGICGIFAIFCYRRGAT